MILSLCLNNKAGGNRVNTAKNKMKKFLIFPFYAANGNVEYHIRKIENPKPHQLSQAVRVCDTYEIAANAKSTLKTESFNKSK
jgi:hypothetical protein